MGWRNPLEPSEFEVQAIAFFKLKEKYKNVRGEYHWKTPEGKQAARFDIAILNEANQVEIVVEVKAKVSHKEWAQSYKYGTLTGKPVIYIRGFGQAEEACSLVRKQMCEMSLKTTDDSLRK